MRQAQFEKEHNELWQAFEDYVSNLEGSRHNKASARVEDLDFSACYRKICSHYALAGSRNYSPALLERLHGLVLRGHPQLYRQHSAWGWRTLHFIMQGFPRTVRVHSAYVWLSLLVFLLPALLVGIGCYLDGDLIYSIMDNQQVAGMESMYDPANRNPGRSVERASETDFVMFGYYIMNNIGIGFRTFAGGILLGIGTLVLLLFNGVVLGGVAGHLTRLGYQDTFWPFVSGHGAFELTAIVICGAAGLMLGHAILAPGQRTRLMALKQQARAALQLVMGAALMLVLAAFIEAFWSSSSLPVTLKYTLAALFWLLVLFYLARMGRNGSH